jgi:hypothetical protein
MFGAWLVSLTVGVVAGSAMTEFFRQTRPDLYKKIVDKDLIAGINSAVDAFDKGYREGVEERKSKPPDRSDD